MNVGTLLVLGRISNLPTVWTNLLAGYVLALAFSGGGIAVDPGLLILLILAVSLQYTGGMYLNDAFDAEADAALRSGRPIPAGKISRQTVFILGAAQITAGLALLFAVGRIAGLFGVVLAAAILLYDWLHKRTSLAPLIMGACRFFVYVIGASAATWPDHPHLLLAALGLWSYTAGLTYAAKHEALDDMASYWPLLLLAGPFIIGAALSGLSVQPLFTLVIFTVWAGLAVRLFARRAPGDVSQGVVRLIAGMSLYDAALVSIYSPELSVLALAGFVLTVVLQRIIPGT